MFDNRVDHHAVFRVHTDQRPVFGGLRKRLEDGPVIYHQHVGIGHEELEAGHALAHHIVHVLQARARKVRDDHVETVVNRGAPFRLLPPSVERVPHARAAALDGEVHDGRGAAEGGRPRAGFKVVAGRGAAERHVQMRVSVNAPRENVHPRGVDDARVGTARHIRPHLADPLALNQHVGLAGFLRGHNDAVLNQSVHFPACCRAKVCRRNPPHLLGLRGTLLPGFKRFSRLDLFHSDATGNRAHQPAQIAADTFVFIHARNSFRRRLAVGADV